MTGIFLIFLSVFWLFFTLIVSLWIARRFKNKSLKIFTGVLGFVVLLPLPVIDEIVGQKQFDALCKEGAVLNINAERIKGRKIKLAFEPANASVPNILVPVKYTQVIFRDAFTNEELGSYGEYVARGGWLIHAIGISESNSPLWMSRNHCAPNVGAEQIAVDYKFEIVR